MKRTEKSGSKAMKGTTTMRRVYLPEEKMDIKIPASSF